ncbi:MAG: tRNA (adenosine(37)-N6)-dimethylallyltransferase MiaA [Prevotellaceae bacterium]|jgi:tRNA dimethylallyltransferase|nr:tRNA (adenosine(37)-N6)-dimethylallyltransferase MiaA [Prevotellaceae bacterium]
MYELITVLGPTASGKTSLATALADELDAEIISADSRQVYKGMDIGTGKDVADYVVEGRQVPYHLIDICEAGEKYNVFEYQHDFHRAYSAIRSKDRIPVLCGGTGMYIESVLKGYKLLAVPENSRLREELKDKSLKELTEMLQAYKPLHNTTDSDSAKRAIRAIEIEEYTKRRAVDYHEFAPLNSLIIGMDIGREQRRQTISARLKSRLREGMIAEVQALLDNDIPPENLIYYGLEYKFITLYLIGEMSYNEMYDRLETAIHRFAKRQMTWFRGMERRGFRIHWLDCNLSAKDKIEIIKQLFFIGK